MTGVIKLPSVVPGRCNPSNISLLTTFILSKSLLDRKNTAVLIKNRVKANFSILFIHRTYAARADIDGPKQHSRSDSSLD